MLQVTPSSFFPGLSLCITATRKIGSKTFFVRSHCLRLYKKGFIEASSRIDRATGNIENGELCNNNNRMKAVNYCGKALHFRALATPLTFHNTFWGLAKGIKRIELFCNKDVMEEEIRVANHLLKTVTMISLQNLRRKCNLE